MLPKVKYKDHRFPEGGPVLLSQFSAGVSLGAAEAETHQDTGFR